MSDRLTLDTARTIRDKFLAVDTQAHAKDARLTSALDCADFMQGPMHAVIAQRSILQFEMAIADMLFAVSVGYVLPIETIPAIVKKIMVGFIDQIIADAEANGGIITTAAFMRTRVRALAFAIQEVTRNATPR
jgi:hypothetical protein